MSNKIVAVSGTTIDSECGSKNIKCKSLNVMGTKYRTTLTKKYEKRKKYEVPDLNKIYSVIPGTIREVLVKEGDHVDEGSTVLVLEAMKMFNRILIPVSGKIKALYVKEGDSVPKHTLLFEIE